jgi:hypothetical protein
LSKLYGVLLAICSRAGEGASVCSFAKPTKAGRREEVEDDGMIGLTLGSLYIEGKVFAVQVCLERLRCRYVLVVCVVGMSCWRWVFVV